MSFVNMFNIYESNFCDFICDGFSIFSISIFNFSGVTIWSLLALRDRVVVAAAASEIRPNNLRPHFIT